MAKTPSPDALAAEFDCLMARAGVTVPPNAAAQRSPPMPICANRSRCCTAGMGRKRSHPTCSV